MYSYTTRVNFFNADGAGVLFFGNIFRIIHSAYEEFMYDAKFKRNYFIDNKYAIPIIHTGSDFLKPIYPTAKIIVNLSVREVKKSSFVLLYEILDLKKELLAKCITVHVFVEKKKWQKSGIPAEIRKYLNIHLVN